MAKVVKKERKYTESTLRNSMHIDFSKRGDGGIVEVLKSNHKLFGKPGMKKPKLLSK